MLGQIQSTLSTFRIRVMHILEVEKQRAGLCASDATCSALKTSSAGPSVTAVHRNLCMACKRNGASDFGGGLV
jgi:hypothetical protein